MPLQARFMCVALAGLLTACGTSAVNAGSSFPAPATATGTWIGPQAAGAKALLYISDGATDDVFVYDFKAGALIGRLHGMQHPYGECVDAGGSVWIADLAAGAVVKYPRGKLASTKRLETGGESVGCSVDPTTGNLAVANVTTASGGGSIRVFASSGHTDYANSQCYYLEQPGYDNLGNLYVEAYTSSYATVVCELAHGGTTLQPIAIDRTIYGPGSTMWDGKYVTLTDESYQGSHSASAIYQMTANGAGGLRTVGTTVLSDSCNGNINVWQPFIVGTKNTPLNAQQGSALVAFDTSCPKRERSKGWDYPGGGHPLANSTYRPAAPDGNAVSLASP